MNRNNLILVIAVAGLLAVSFLAGYQVHEPRVVTETNTVTEVQTVEVPEVVTQTETEVEKISVPTDDAKDHLSNSDQYVVFCDEYSDGDKGGTAFNLNQVEGSDTNLNQDEFVLTVDWREVSDDVVEEAVAEEEITDELVQEKCGIEPEENVDKELFYEGDGQ